MTSRKTVKSVRSIKRTSTPRYKIGVEMPFGPCESHDHAKAMKADLKKRSPGMKFSASTLRKNGVHFTGSLHFVKNVDMGATELKNVLMQRIPGAKITVTKA